jgi:hypothetical protein
MQLKLENLKEAANKQILQLSEERSVDDSFRQEVKHLLQDI